MADRRICAKLRRWLGMDPELTCEALWQSHWNDSDAWERAQSNEDELWWGDSDRNRALIEEAQALRDADAEAAFRMFLKATEAGSAVELEFVPAYFWLARLRYERAPTRATCRAIRPLLDYAARQGHPGAKQALGRLMVKGKFGLLTIPRGLKLLYESRPPILTQPDRASTDSLKSRALEAATQE